MGLFLDIHKVVNYVAANSESGDLSPEELRTNFVNETNFSKKKAEDIFESAETENYFEKIIAKNTGIEVYRVTRPKGTELAKSVIGIPYGALVEYMNKKGWAVSFFSGSGGALLILAIRWLLTGEI